MIDNNLFLGDCKDFMANIPDDYFDLMIADLPYGHEINYFKRPQDMYRGAATRKRRYPDDLSWNIKLTPEYFKEFFRISKNQLFFGANYFSDCLPASSGWVVWDKENTGNWSDCELIWTSFDRGIRKIKWRWNGMIQERMGIEKEKRFHPTQKPVGMIKHLLAMFAKPGEKIFDPCAGSGSILIAAKEEGFIWSGCEKERKYYDIAVERIEKSKENLKLF